MHKIVFSGGDSRMSAAHRYLLALGYDSTLSSTDEFPDASAGDYVKLAGSADVLVLPAPLTADGVHVRGTADVDAADIFSSIKAGASVFSGAVPDIYKKPSVRYFNYLEDEAYIIYMAYLTAEGTLGHLLSAYPRALDGKSIVIVGWGRIAKYLYTQLLHYTKHITVILRRRELIDELMRGGVCAHDFSELSNASADADIVINTVPSLVLTADVLAKMSGDAYVIDLASKPGGVDFTAARGLGVTVHHLLALPGKCAPVSAGEALARCIIKNLEMNGDII